VLLCVAVFVAVCVAVFGRVYPIGFDESECYSVYCSVCCSVLQCLLRYVLQCVAGCTSLDLMRAARARGKFAFVSSKPCVAVCCSVSQCVAVLQCVKNSVSCNVCPALQCIAVCVAVCAAVCVAVCIAVSYHVLEIRCCVMQVLCCSVLQCVLQ